MKRKRKYIFRLSPFLSLSFFFSLCSFLTRGEAWGTVINPRIFFNTHIFSCHGYGYFIFMVDWITFFIHVITIKQSIQEKKKINQKSSTSME
ncbi:hypothetical protein BDC45DRAFT_506459 [Circinella umbellata]|nr:hypothetical protein BDC45DRAFT_506459 [Circinella umbellata]